MQNRWFYFLWWPVYLWTMPWTLLGVIAGYSHGWRQCSIQFRRGTIGIFGPGVAKLLRRVPIVGGARAMTLGHTILACDEQSWVETFEHEFIHVRQYQWFGPFFVPAYLLESAWQWSRGRSPYYDNRFEKQAYENS